MTLARLAPLLLATLAACQHAQWVSPYSADLQSRAADMLADLTAWEGQMRAAAGTPAADPRNPPVQAKLAAWRGEIEAMAAIELSIDPGLTSCDALAGRISGQLRTSFPILATNDTAPRLNRCETLPDIFARMQKRVADGSPPASGIGFDLIQQCQLPIPDGQFAAALQAGASKPVAFDPGVAIRCAALFEPLPGQAHGPATQALATELEAIIYREGREQAATHG